MIHIALAGKGSSGKSTLLPFLIERLTGRGRLLVVDADPHQSASRILGLSPTVTLGSLRSRYERQFKSGAGLPPDESRETFAEGRMGEEALLHSDGYDFLPMGHWEPDGSQCMVNRVLGRALSSLAGRYDSVLVDNEAGIEHVGRFTIPIALLLLVATPDPLFLDVAARIWQRCREVQRPVEHVHLVINRVCPCDDAIVLPDGLPLAGISRLPESPTLQQLSRARKSPLDLARNDPWRAALEDALTTILAFPLPVFPPTFPPSTCDL